MARVNVEESFWARGGTVKMAVAMGINEHECKGLVLDLWHDSQDELRVNGTAEEIVEWARCVDHLKASKLIAGLMRARFISPIEGTDLYKIHGNDTQIEGRVNMLKGSTKGAQKTKERWASLKQAMAEIDSPGHSPSHGQPTQTPRPIQCNSIQTNSDQFNSGHKTRARVDSPPRDKLGDLAVLGVTEVISVIHTVGRDADAARSRINPLVWQVLSMKYPSGTWENFCTLYEQAAKRSSTAFFEKDLRSLFEAHIPLLGQRHSIDPALPPESA